MINNLTQLQKIIIGVALTLILFIWGWGGHCKEQFQFTNQFGNQCFGSNNESSQSYNMQEKTRRYYSVVILFWTIPLLILFKKSKK